MSETIEPPPESRWRRAKQALACARDSAFTPWRRCGEPGDTARAPRFLGWHSCMGLAVAPLLTGVLLAASAPTPVVAPPGSATLMQHIVQGVMTSPPAPAWTRALVVLLAAVGWLLGGCLAGFFGMSMLAGLDLLAIGRVHPSSWSAGTRAMTLMPVSAVVYLLGVLSSTGAGTPLSLALAVLLGVWVTTSTWVAARCRLRAVSAGEGWRAVTRSTAVALLSWGVAVVVLQIAWTPYVLLPKLVGRS